MSIKFKIKKGDEVIVTTGKNAGSKGSVVKIITKTSKAIVSGVNIVSRNTKASMANAGGIIKKEMPLHISNLSHIDPKTKLPTKIGYKILEDGRKVRFAKKSGEIIDK